MNTQAIAETPRFKWHGDQIVYEGDLYGWSNSDTPSVWIVGEGWKPLVWASFPDFTLAKRRAYLKELILDRESN